MALAILLFVARADVSIWAAPGLSLPSDTPSHYWTLELTPPPPDTVNTLPTMYLLAEPLGPVSSAPTPTPNLAASRGAATTRLSTAQPVAQTGRRVLRQHKDSTEVNPWALDLRLGERTRRDSLDLRTYEAFHRREGLVRVWNDSVITLLSRSDRQKQGELKIGLQLPSAVTSIVGEGGAGLKVSGYQRIAFAGRSQWNDGQSVSTVKQNKFPSLKMEQINRFTVEGTIGSKITVSVDQDSRRTTDLENRIIVRYKSDEDDIIQSIDLGNTTIALSDARFIGYSERIQGLFGIGMAGKVGAVDWKAIASQEKGNTARSRLTAGANEQEIIIRDYQFDRYRFFDVGRIGGENYLGPGDQIVEFWLYQGVGSLDPNQPEAVAYPNSQQPSASPDSVKQRFRELGITEDYELIQDTAAGKYYVFFPTRLQNIQTSVIAYYMVVRKANGATLAFGDRSTSPFRLQMLKRANPQPSDPLWEAEWKNVYDLRIRNIDYLQLDLDIYKGAVGDEANRANKNQQSDGQYYLRIFDLDRTNSTGAATPDGKVDDDAAILDTTRGLLIFPSRRPFADNELLIQRIPSLYSSANPNDLRDSSKYYLKLTSRQRSKQVSLGTINILEGSEVVTKNGQRLSRDLHYEIDYTTGIVTFIDDNVLDPTATVTIDYEYAPFISAEKRTLFGFSAKYEPTSTLRTGATVLYKGTKATDRPAQLGAEPYRDFVGEYFLNWSTSPDFLTSMANAVPLINTKANSALSFQGAIARSMPNPNTRGSVFIDDFEGTKRASGLGVIRESWSIASPPYAPNGSDLLASRGLHDPAFIWFNPYTQFQDIDIYDRDPNRDRTADRRTHVLVLEARPQRSQTREAGDPNTAAWGGIMRGLPFSQWDQSRAEYLEIRMAVVRHGNNAGMLRVDLGRISEDVNDNGSLDTEDRPEGPGLPPNKILDIGEDVGLDGLTDVDEVSADGTPYDPVTNPDPAGDNWSYDSDPDTRNNYDRINGTENSLSDPVRGSRPDTEDLGGESEFDRVNAYYQLAINLDDEFDPALVQNSEKTSGDVTGFANALVWKTYRIPLWDSKYYQTFADPGVKPDSNQIQYARLWLSGADSTTRIYIAAADIVERTWKSTLVGGDTITAQPAPDFQLGVKNTEENADYFSPPGVSGYRDPRTNYREKEQSLILVYQNFRAGDEGKAEITVTKEDFTGYRNLAMWVHADSSARDGKTLFYLRFGQNAQNYYEYIDTLRFFDNHDENWRANQMLIDFNQITALKDTTGVGRSDSLEYVFDPVYRTGVRGQPSLASIIYREIGVLRVGDPMDPPVSGETWFDELRLEEVRKDPGLAASGRLTVQMADLIGGTVGLDAKTYSFRQLNEGRSSSVQAGGDQLKYSANGNLALHKFLPESWGVNLPISATFNEDLSTPRLLTGSDIVLTEERQKDERSRTISKGLSIPVTIRPKSTNWLVTSTLSALTTRFSLTHTRQTTPTRGKSTADGYTAYADYKLKFGERLTFPPLFWTRYLLFPKRLYATPFSILPTDFRAQGTMQRTSSVQESTLGDVTTSYVRSFNGTSGVNFSPIPSVAVKFDMTTNRDLSDENDLNLSLNPRKFKFGRELGYSQNASASYRPNLVSFLAPTFNYTTVFNDKIDRLNDDHDVSGSRSWSISGTFEPAKFWGFMGARAKAGGGGGNRAAANQPRTDKRMGARAQEKDRDKEEKPDTTEAPKPAATGGGGAMPVDAWRSLMGGLRWLTSPIGATTLNYGRSNGDTRRDLDNRPTWRYRFGFDLDEQTPLAPNLGSGSQILVNTKTDKETFSAKNQINLFGVINLSSGYTANKTSTIKAGSSSNATEGQIFPSLSTGLQRLERFFLLRWLFSSASARFGYERKRDETFTGGVRQSETITKQFSPLFSVQGTTKNGITTNVSYDIGEAETRQFNNRQVLRKEANSVRITGNYSFSSPNGIPLPILRGLRLRSTMSLSVGINYKVDESYNRPDSVASFTLTGSSKSLSITPQATYSFSMRVKGGMTAEWTDRNDISPSSGRRKTHVRSLGFWAEFTF